MSLPVYLTGPGGLATAAPGVTARLEGEEGRHAVQVRRTRVGEVIELVDGAGRRARGAVTTVGPRLLELVVDAVLDEPAPQPRLVLVQALAKGGRDEQAVAMACEVGIDAVVPWQAARSIVRWDGPRAAKGPARWRAALEAATKQSRRAWLPPVAEVHTSLRELVAQTVAAGGAALVLHEEATDPIAGAPLPATAPDVLIVVGPEGGLSDDEVAGLRAAGAQLVRLGPHVLRSATAGTVATAVLAQRLGRWEAPSGRAPAGVDRPA